MEFFKTPLYDDTYQNSPGPKNVKSNHADQLKCLEITHPTLLLTFLP